jgi:hypothetical protein
MPVKSLGGSLYYVTFIDEFSRKTWLYLLQGCEQCTYYKVVNNTPIILLLYVEDMFLTGGEPLIIQCKK